MAEARDLLVIVPSRSRPDNVAALATAWADTGTTAHLMVCVDDDDETAGDYARVQREHGNFRLAIGPRLRLGGTLNNYARREAPSRAAIGFMGDDHRPRTQGWDEQVMAAMTAAEAERRYGVVYGNDLFQGQNLPTAVFMSAEIIRRIGYMVPPKQVHLYLDDFWKQLGSTLDALRYLPDTIIEHMHPAAGKGASDPLYDEVNSPQMYDADRAAFADYIFGGDWAADLEKLRQP